KSCAGATRMRSLILRTRSDTCNRMLFIDFDPNSSAKRVRRADRASARPRRRKAYIDVETVSPNIYGVHAVQPADSERGNTIGYARCTRAGLERHTPTHVRMASTGK